MEVAGLVLAIPPIIAGIRKCARLFGELCQQIRDVDGYISCLITECQVLATALEQAGHILPESHLSSVAAECCRATGDMEQLLQRSGITRDSLASLDTVGKARLVFRMENIQPIIDRLDRCHKNIDTCLLLAQL